MAENPKLVSDAACKGCRHYGYIYSEIRCCNYCFDTGHPRPRGELPAECSVKRNGRRATYIKRLIREGKLRPEDFGMPLGL